MNANTIEHNFIDTAIHLGKCWAAMRDNNVISIISMRVPNDVDFDAFRKKAIETLELVGDVKAGDLYSKDNEDFFLARPHKHQNRSKKKPKTENKPIKLYKPNNEQN